MVAPMASSFPCGARMLVVASLALAALVAAVDARAGGKPLVWGADAEGGAPYVFQDPAHPGVQQGFEVDLAKALTRELGRPVEFHQYEYVSLLAGLDRGDIDLAMNGIEVTKDREEKVRFSRPYYVNREQLVARAGDARCATFASCLAAKGRIATLGDTAAERLLDARGANKRIYDGQVEPYSDLALGRVEAVLLDLPIAVYFARRDKRLVVCRTVAGQGDVRDCASQE